MPGAPIPSNEAERLLALRSYDVLAGKREESLDAICRVVSTIFGSSIALVSISDWNRQVVRGKVGAGPDELARELAPCAYAILGTEPMIVEDMSNDARFFDNPMIQEPNNVRFYVGAPLLTPDGLALGTLCAIDSFPQRPRPEHVAALGNLASTVMTMLNMRKAMLGARNLALIDGLTGLANRSGLMMNLETIIQRSRRDGSPFALLYLDIDNFKYINDSRGHAEGDELLRKVGLGLSHSVRDIDIAGRLGGDEFAVLIPDCDGIAASTLAHRVFDSLTASIVSKVAPVGFSIGVAIFSRPPSDAYEAFVMADRIMYSAKHGGKNRVVVLSAPAFEIGVQRPEYRFQ